jgi:hypothetical protein
LIDNQKTEQISQKPPISEEELIALFSKGEKAVKTPRNANQNQVQTNETPLISKPKNNKKKGKK